MKTEKPQVQTIIDELSREATTPEEVAYLAHEQQLLDEERKKILAHRATTDLIVVDGVVMSAEEQKRSREAGHAQHTLYNNGRRA